MQFTKKLKSFLLAFLLWELAGALYLIFRFLGAPKASDWTKNIDSLLWVLFLSGLFFSSINILANYVSNLKKLNKLPFHYHIAFKIIFLFFSCIAILAVTRIAAYFEGYITMYEILPSFLKKIHDNVLLSFFIYACMISVIFAIVKHMIEIIGHKTLLNLLLGKYHTPQEEERIVMFLDLKSSTLHAEQLGHKNFCELIQDCFRDLTSYLIEFDAEIYQYVGDEVIITWPIAKGIKNFNCLNIFFSFKKHLLEKKDYYLNKYNICPEFKAGINIGKITIAEVGVIKKTIAYLSDVLNTASHLQSICGTYNKQLLVSAELIKLLPQDLPFTVDNLGDLLLKERKQAINVFSIEAKQQIDNNFN